MKRNRLFIMFLFFMIFTISHSKNALDKCVMKDFCYYDMTCVSKNGQIHISGLSKRKLLLSGYCSVETLGKMFYRHAYYIPDIISSSDAMEYGVCMQEKIDANSSHYTLRLDSSTTVYVQCCRIKGEYVKQDVKKYIGMSYDFINIYKHIKYPQNFYTLKRIIAIRKI